MSAKKCTAKSKRTGERCKANAVSGRDVCYHHGGKSKTGAEVNTYKTGRYSKYLPDRLAARYAEACNDGELISLRDELALLDLRIGDLVQSLDTGESKQTWLVLAAAWREYTDSSGEEREKLAERIGELLSDGLSEGHTWSEIAVLAEQRRKLADGERRRLVDMQQMVTAERAMTFVGAIAAVIRKHVDDRETLAAISADIQGLMVADGGRVAGGAFPG